jgi:hypothetical protein
MIVSTLLIPTLGLSSFEELASKDLENTCDIATKAINNSQFYVRSLTSLCFFSSAYYIFDAPHWGNKTMQKMTFLAKPLHMHLSPVRFVDEFYFDVSWYFAYALVVFSIGLFFSTIAPAIPIICFIWFYVKYWIDKYNFIYVYHKKYVESTVPF